MVILLSLGAGLALWLSLPVRRRPAPGSGTFLWLLGAIAAWCLAGVGHWLASTLEAKLLWARVQYLGIASVPVFWTIFAFEYAGLAWTRGRRVLFLWVVPVLTVVAALTNGWHRALWSSVTLTSSGAAVYSHGWWFWIAAAYNYVLVVAGTGCLVKALRRAPRFYRGQFATLLAAALLPLGGNFLYITRTLPFEGIDPTPLMFTLSAVLFTAGLFRNRLFELVPVARDRVVESLSDAVVVIDSSRRVLDLNAAAARIAGVPRGIGLPIEQVMPFLDGTLLTSGFTSESQFTVTADPQRFDVRVMPVHGDDDRLVGWAVLIRDVTEQQRAAEEREALELRMQEQQKRESLSVLAAGLAHDFNNLLTGILGHADLLALRLSSSSEAGSSVGAIILGAQRAADLVSKMLAYAGERHGASDEVDLDGLTREMHGLLQASVARHCTLMYRGDPVNIFADPVQIRQVVMNLIINAAEAVDEIRGRIEVVVGKHHLSQQQLALMRFGEDAPPGPYAFLEVRDNGSGMDEATLRRIFTPFYSTKHTGHGLGLAAVQGIVRGHRGALRIDSREGQGTCVIVWLPIGEAEPDQSRLASPAAASLIS